MKNMKIVFFGTPEVAVPSLETLKEVPYINISAVVTQPDKPVGRKKTLTPSPVKQKALDLGLEVLQPKNKKELQAVLSEIPADLYVVIAYGMIMPKAVLEKPKHGAINVHFSLLPK